ncbi:hypothetical protein ACEWY4_007271 [Coilia grayii]|uniref:CARD domain-containing protein n=1 Tax=Coilia grayii TaxID=363190 RepID=A0ABD1KG23_9TELE
MDIWESWSTEEQLEVQEEVFERLRSFLCQKLVAERHLDFLRSQHILSREDAEDICGHVSTARRAGRMLDYIVKVPQGLGFLVASIRKVRTQDFVAERIVHVLEAVQKEREAADKEGEHDVGATTPKSHLCCSMLASSDVTTESETILSSLVQSCYLSPSPSSHSSDLSYTVENFDESYSRVDLFSGGTELAGPPLSEVSSVSVVKLD